MKKILQYLLMIFLISAGLIGSIYTMYNSYLIIEGQTWKPYIAKINSAHIKEVNQKNGNTYHGEIEYEFLYKQKKFTGNKFTLMDNALTIKERKDFFQKYKINSKIMIYINPNNPKHASVIKPKLSYLFFELFLLMLGIMIIMVGFSCGGFIPFSSSYKLWNIYSLTMFYFLFLATVIGIINQSDKESFYVVGIITSFLFSVYLFYDAYQSKVKKNSKFMGKRYWIRKDAKMFKKILYTKLLLGTLSLYFLINLSYKLFT